MQQPQFPSFPGKQRHDPIHQSPDLIKPSALGHSEFRYGLIFGGILALLSLGMHILSLTALWTFVARLLAVWQDNVFVFTMMSIVTWYVIQGIIAGIIYGVAGFISARHTGQLRSGVVTCLWASLWYLLIDGILAVIFMILSFSNEHLPFAYIITLLFDYPALLGVALPVFLNVILALTLGVGIGRIGARIGKEHESN